MEPIELSGTIEETFRETIQDHPNRRYFDPNLETFGIGGSFPDDPEFQLHAANISNEIRLPFISLPQKAPKIPTDKPPRTMESEFPWPKKFLHCFGQSGWDHINRAACFLTIEFDSPDGHDKSITKGDMQEVEDFLSSLSYMSVNRSTSGKGLHCRLMIEPQPAKTRADYNRLRRAGVRMLDSLGGPRISELYDSAGRGILWLWKAEVAQ